MSTQGKPFAAPPDTQQHCEREPSTLGERCPGIQHVCHWFGLKFQRDHSGGSAEDRLEGRARKSGRSLLRPAGEDARKPGCSHVVVG